MASYPTTTKTFTTKADGAGNTIMAAHVNDLQSEVTAIEAALLATGLAHHLLFVDATYDIGASGATRPRHLYLSGNIIVSGYAEGRFTINSVITNQGARLQVAADAAVEQGVWLHQVTNQVGSNYIVFSNAAAVNIGSITELAGYASIAFNTSSDRRLKTDLGRATDLSGLSSLLVHDFLWTAEGVKDRGIFAQEAYDVYQKGITVGSDERDARGNLLKPWMADYSKYVPDLIVGWQNHEARLAALEAA